MVFRDFRPSTVLHLSPSKNGKSSRSPSPFPSPSSLAHYASRSPLSRRSSAPPMCPRSSPTRRTSAPPMCTASASEQEVLRAASLPRSHLLPHRPPCTVRRSAAHLPPRKTGPHPHPCLELDGAGPCLKLADQRWLPNQGNPIPPISLRMCPLPSLLTRFWSAWSNSWQHLRARGGLMLREGAVCRRARGIRTNVPKDA
jgi:hypothetical protein